MDRHNFSAHRELAEAAAETKLANAMAAKADLQAQLTWVRQELASRNNTLFYVGVVTGLTVAFIMSLLFGGGA